jgi:hypothetical protein
MVPSPSSSTREPSRHLRMSLGTAAGSAQRHQPMDRRQQTRPAVP